MIPHQQLIKHDPESGAWGDCHRTCVASILNLEPGQVPHFCDNDNPNWLADERAWLADRGLVSAMFGFPGDGVSLGEVLHTTKVCSPGVPMILGGTSSLGVSHSVVIMDGVIASDPSGNGIVGPCPDGWYWVQAISVGDTFKVAA